MMRESMQLERIAGLLTYVNGVAGDKSDDIIPESELYDYLCRIIDELMNDEAGETPSLRGLISKTLESYEERTPGARRRLENACEMIIYAYFSTMVRQKANSLYENLFPGRQ